jgi:hypothetical protein
MAWPEIEPRSLCGQKPATNHIHHETGCKNEMTTVLNSQNTSYTYIIKISWWRLYRKTIAVYQTNHMKHKQTICGQNATFTVYTDFICTNCYTLQSQLESCTTWICLPNYSDELHASNSHIYCTETNPTVKCALKSYLNYQSILRWGQQTTSDP